MNSFGSSNDGLFDAMMASNGDALLFGDGESDALQRPFRLNMSTDESGSVGHGGGIFGASLDGADLAMDGGRSGVLVSPDGHVLTAGHVIDGPGRPVRVTLHDGAELLGAPLTSRK